MVAMQVKRGVVLQLCGHSSLLDLFLTLPAPPPKKMSVTTTPPHFLVFQAVMTFVQEYTYRSKPHLPVKFHNCKAPLLEYFHFERSEHHRIGCKGDAYLASAFQSAELLYRIPRGLQVSVPIKTINSSALLKCIGARSHIERFLMLLV